MAQTYAYSLFGLQIRSELELPELFIGSAQAETDVTIRLAPATADLPGPPGARENGPSVDLVIDEVGRFRVTGGSEIVVQQLIDAPAKNVRLFLLGSAMGLILHQRRLLPLHANAVEIDGRAFAFMGDAGAGKSTLAAWFHDRGHRLIADDVCVIGFGPDGVASVLPGLPRLRLWREALERSGRAVGAHPRSFHGDDDYDKYDVSLFRDATTERPLALGGIYQLAQGERLAIEPLTGVTAVGALFSNTYRGEYLSLTTGYEEHLDACLRLVAATPLHRAARRWGSAEMDDQNEGLQAHARGISTGRIHSDSARVRAGICR